MSASTGTRGRWHTTPGRKTLTMRVSSGRAHWTLKVDQTLGIKTWAWHLYLCGVAISSGSAPEPGEAKKAVVKAMRDSAEKLFEDAMSYDEGQDER